MQLRNQLGYIDSKESKSKKTSKTSSAYVLKTLHSLENKPIKTIHVHPKIRKSSFVELNSRKDPLFLVANAYTKEALQTLLSQFGESVLTSTDKEGNNVLHLAVRTNSTTMIYFILDLLGDKADLLCKTMNNSGNLPLYIAHEVRNPTKKAKLINLLLPKTLDYSIKPLASHLDPREIPEKYPESKDNPILQENLELAYDVINQCRSDVLFSSTHPDTNNMYVYEKAFVDSKISHLRSETSYYTLKKPEEIHKTAEIIRKYKAGNCGELATLAVDTVLSKHVERPLSVEYFTLKKGDHAFVVLGRDDKSNINNFGSYGKNAVYLDPWAGEAIPILNENFKKKFKAYATVTYNKTQINSYILLPKYNPKHDSLLSENKIILRPPGCMTPPSKRRRVESNEEGGNLKKARLEFHPKM